MGVAGSGKSSVGRELARRLRWDFAEGDDLHSPANVAKMARGEPLSDADRGPWLIAVSEWVALHTASRRPGIITCSALKRRYRDLIRAEHVVFVHLAPSREQLVARLARRTDHFLPPALLDSQLADLEPLGPDEAGVSVTSQTPPADQAQEVIDLLNLAGSAR